MNKPTQLKELNKFIKDSTIEHNNLLVGDSNSLKVDDSGNIILPEGSNGHISVNTINGMEELAYLSDVGSSSGGTYKMAENNFLYISGTYNQNADGKSPETAFDSFQDFYYYCDTNNITKIEYNYSNISQFDNHPIVRCESDTTSNILIVPQIFRRLGVADPVEISGIKNLHLGDNTYSGKVIVQDVHDLSITQHSVKTNHSFYNIRFNASASDHGTLYINELHNTDIVIESSGSNHGIELINSDMKLFNSTLTFYASVFTDAGPGSPTINLYNNSHIVIIPDEYNDDTDLIVNLYDSSTISIDRNMYQRYWGFKDVMPKLVINRMSPQEHYTDYAYNLPVDNLLNNDIVFYGMVRRPVALQKGDLNCSVIKYVPAYDDPNIIAEEGFNCYLDTSSDELHFSFMNIDHEHLAVAYVHSYGSTRNYGTFNDFQNTNFILSGVASIPERQSLKIAVIDTANQQLMHFYDMVIEVSLVGDMLPAPYDYILNPFNKILTVTYSEQH